MCVANDRKVAEGVLQQHAEIAIRLVRDRTQHDRTGRDRPLDERAHVFHVDIELNRRAA